MSSEINWEKVCKDSKFVPMLEQLEDAKVELTHNTPLKDIVQTALEQNSEYTDNVVHPSHYTQNGKIECIDAIAASMTPDEFAGYCKGNCLKYIWRFENKNGVEDLEKAQVYLTWLINTLKGENLTK